ncbi:transcriptional regulatory protein pdtaR [Rhodoferax lithotrophicus]|uniref:Transcriptional regulatory protein pdtaR n=1 Tax=Rhodoferax lithotrophicus TaxID=2798804 RepID=A0ABM7MGS8_9BURK|nr:response regulator [Rhodoferax sp. MIZ03]BCO25399.1 transcriptional regulatory protein pdtaR [Rhodoferax sp. MIZ03]
MNTPKVRTNGCHLLLVDDDRLVLSMLALALTHAGYQITTAESAEEAENCLSEGCQRPQLVILDVQMPDQNGLTLAQRLHELDHIPFMILSAYSDAETVQKATAQGALGYAVKPIDPAQLIPAIEAALARANDLHELRTTRMQLQTALDNERDINLAVGITMMQHRLSRKAAFDMLRQSARRQQRKLSELAQGIIHAAEAIQL